MISGRKWLILSLAIVMVLSLVTYTGVTHSFFVDNEQSTDDALGIRWGLFTLSDGFENTGSPAWDDLWDENGTTDWVQSTSQAYGGSTYSAAGETPNNGYLTSDEIEASTATGISVSFQFFPKQIGTNECWVQTYNGTDYQNWVDLGSGVNLNNWNQFQQVISDPQYLIAGFRIRFDSTSISANGKIYIDDVMITTDTTPPAAPQNPSATGYPEYIYLDWDDNSEGDLLGYNVYRSTTPGSGHVKINGSTPVPDSEYADSPLYGVGTYYYFITAVDYGYNESDNSTPEVYATTTNAPPATPTLLTASGNGTVEGIDLDWEDNIETDNITYTVYRSPDDESSYSEIASLLATSNYTDSGLYGGRTYYYKVKAVDGYSASSANTTGVSTSATDLNPAAPTSPNAVSGLDEKIELTWTESTSPDVVGYKVWRGASSGTCTYLRATLGITDSYTDEYLYGGGQYFYVITAFDAANPTSYGSANSTEVSATANDIAPAMPTGLSVTPHPSSEAINLDWDDNIETDGITYTIYRSENDESGYSVRASLVAASEYTDSNLYGGRTYYYKVQAVDSANPIAYGSANTSGMSAVVNDLNPAPPTGVNAAGANEEILLTWTESTSPDVVGYKVWRGTSSGNCTELKATLGTTDNYTDENLYGGGHYYYVITSFDEANPVSCGSANSTEVDAVANDAAPAIPAGVNSTAGSENITVQWAPNTEDDLSHYEVHSGNNTGGPYAWVADVTAPATSYVHSPLYGEVTQYYVVKAVDDGNNVSGNSLETSNTTIDVPPGPPASVNATGWDGYVELDWDDNPETDNITYTIYRSPETNDNYSQLASLIITSNYTDNDVSGGTLYYYIINAVDFGSNVSDNSTEVSSTPVDNAPAQPTGLSAQRGNQKVTLSWTQNSEEDMSHYEIHRGTDTGGPYTNVDNVTHPTTVFIDTGLTAGQPYYYVIKAVDGNENKSIPSIEKSATPWEPYSWIQTSQADFEAGVSDNVSTTLNPGDVLLGVGGDAGGANMILFWDGGAAPDGWTIVSDSGGDFFERFPRGADTYGGTGGSANHSHTASYSTTSTANGTVNIASGSNAGASTTTHTHNADSSSIDSADNLPLYRNLRVIEYNSGVPVMIPQGAIAVFETLPASGWTRLSDQDGRYVRGDATANGTGGSENHSHTINIQTGTPIGTANLKTGGSYTYATDTHTHSATGSTSVVANDSPYISVILGKADSDIAVPAGMIAMFDATPTGSWEVLSGSGGDFFERFLIGSNTYGTTGGSGSHTHNDEMIDLTVVTGTASDGKNTQASYASDTHTHTVNVTAISQDAGNSLPPYREVIFARALYYSSGMLASQVRDTTVDGSEWTELSWSETLPSGADIVFQVRASDTMFTATNTTLSWISVGGTSPVTSGLPSGRYKQWRVILTPNGTRLLSPTLHDVTMYHQAD